MKSKQLRELVSYRLRQAKETLNEAKILFDDEIWSRISEDGQEKPDNILMNRGCHLKAISDKDEYVGLVFLHSINLSTIEVHINIIKR